MIMDNLEEIWKELCSPYCSNRSLIRRCWQDIQNAYQGRRRYYHNLQHLTHLMDQARQYQSTFKDYDALCFSIFYHDIMYSALRKDNETRSAEFARKKLDRLGFPTLRSNRVDKQIRATQLHQIPLASTDPDLPYFLDFDLLILASDWDRYYLYTLQIRKEYKIFPGWMYRKGRRKVLTHFLERRRLFFTPIYFERYELRARENLKKELALLGAPPQ